MNLQTGNKNEHPLRHGDGWEKFTNAQQGGEKTAQKLRRREDEEEEDYEGELDLHEPQDE
jgi:hypothetical protein